VRYVIAGGGAYGSHYVHKLNEAHASGLLDAVHEVLVVDANPCCQAAPLVAELPWARLVVSPWRSFGGSVFEEPGPWRQDVWIPAPIAPHVLAEWLTDQVAARFGLSSSPSALRVGRREVAFERQLPDGRLLLSHAPGVCPLDCTEPGECAITQKRRWWEMSDTVSELLAPSGVAEHAVARFFCRHHCDPGELDLGGIRFATILDQSVSVLEAVASGERTIGVATYSSCHGVINLFDLAPSAPGHVACDGSAVTVAERP
jgi:hypothetical protein